MSSLFSELSTLWSVKLREQARQAQRQRIMAAFHVLRDINFAAPWDQKPGDHCTEC